MVNKAIYTSLATMKAAPVAPIQAALASTIFPKFVWNAISGKIEFLCSIEWMYDINTPTVNKLFLSMNPKLALLFDTFSNICYSKRNTNDITPSPPQLIGSEYVFYFPYNYGINSHQETINNISKEIFINSQQASSVPSWSPVDSLTFNTFQIPVNNSLVASPEFAGIQLDTTQSENTLSNILTDFTLPLERGDEYANQMNYFIPTSEYRLFDLVSDSYLKSLNIAVKWLDNYGGVHPLYLKYGTTASIKLMFRKKDFNKSL
jgi:hypothetical protein